MSDVPYNASVYRDAVGNVLGVFAPARDMTSETEAFEAAQRMASVVEYSDDAIIGSTLEGVITNWNPAAERLFGHPRKRIADWDRQLSRVRRELHVIAFLEPELAKSNTEAWGGCSPPRRQFLPGTANFVADRNRNRPLIGSCETSVECVGAL